MHLNCSPRLFFRTLRRRCICQDEAPTADYLGIALEYERDALRNAQDYQPDSRAGNADPPGLHQRYSLTHIPGQAQCVPALLVAAKGFHLQSLSLGLWYSQYIPPKKS